MSKKLIFISILLILLLLSLVGYYFILKYDTGGSTQGTVKNFFSFLPFGSDDSETIETPIDNPLTPIGVLPQTNFTEKLRKISSAPVAGAGTMDVKVGTTTKMGTVVRHIEKATGHIYETELFSPNQNRISNTTIPTVADAIWGNKNISLIARYLKDDNQTVDTFSITLKNISTTTENVISGIAFPADISDVSVFGTSVFYLQQSPSGSAGFISSFDGKTKKQIWNSPLKDTLSQYVNTGTLALTTKPAQNVPGFLYFVNTSSGQIKKILSGISGLSTLVSPDSNQTLYLSQDSRAELSIYDQVLKKSTALNPVTFPEKCTWSKKDKNIVYCAVPQESLEGNSLTLWYKGLVSWTDAIWKYDIKNNTSSVLVSLEEEGEYIDVIKPILSDNEQYLVFMNKTDNTLWSLDLSQ